jgi:hypothetical protein
MLNESAPLEGSEQISGAVADLDWLAVAEEAYNTSTDYLDANHRKQWERNVANFQCRHPKGSKYHSDAYRFRNRLYRPKVRSSVKRSEAVFAQAMFATTDVINVSPADATNKQLEQESEVWEALLNYRLKNHMPWYLIAVGAFQEAQVYGVVISKQSWEYSERTYKEKVSETDIDPFTQDEIVSTRDVDRVEVLSDKPRIDLIEIENFRFDPAADWTDPIGSSPYVIEIMPMYLNDVMARMTVSDPQTSESEWSQLTESQVLRYGQVNADGDTMRRDRNNESQDPTDLDHGVNDFKTIWVHRNIVRRDGEDWEFYTLSTNFMLSEPRVLDSPIGRGYRVGITNLEAHRAIPSSYVEMGEGLQAAANHLQNQRFDNVELVLNKGWRVQRQKNTDLGALRRSFPGRIVMTDDPNSIQPDIVPDVTTSAYAEQDRLNMDMDDILGGFSASSVGTNRQLGETVGGMQMFQQSGNALTDYTVRTFVETWVEPTLNDIVTLIQAYESDEVIAAFAGDVPVERGEVNGATLKVGVSVGFGNLDPRAKAKGVVDAISVIAQVAPHKLAKLDVGAVANELFGVLGYRDGSRFFPGIDEEDEPRQDPNTQTMQMDMQLKQQELQLKQQELQVKAQGIQMAQEKQIMEAQVQIAKLEAQREIEVMKLAEKRNLTLEQMYAKLELDQDKLNLDILREAGRREDSKITREEMMLKQQMGSGI